MPCTVSLFSIVAALALRCSCPYPGSSDLTGPSLPASETGPERRLQAAADTLITSSVLSGLITQFAAGTLQRRGFRLELSADDKSVERVTSPGGNTLDHPSLAELRHLLRGVSPYGPYASSATTRHETNAAWRSENTFRTEIIGSPDPTRKRCKAVNNQSEFADSTAAPDLSGLHCTTKVLLAALAEV